MTAAADQFVADATWPKLDDLRRAAARAGSYLQYDPWGDPIPRELGFIGNQNDVVLNVAGLARSGRADGYVRQFVHLVEICYSLYISDDPEPKISSDILRSAHGLDDQAIARLGDLLPREGYLTSGGNPTSPTDWLWHIADGVARFKDVHTVEEFLAVRGEMLKPHPILAQMQAAPINFKGTLLGNELGIDHPTATSAQPLLDIDSLQADVAAAIISLATANRLPYAVLEAAKAFMSVLRRVSGLPTDLDGTPLVETAFAQLQPRDASKHGRSRFQGLQRIAIGMTMAYRNRSAHELETLGDEEAAEVIATFSLLARSVEDLNPADPYLGSFDLICTRNAHEARDQGR